VSVPWIVCIAVWVAVAVYAPIVVRAVRRNRADSQPEVSGEAGTVTRPAGSEESTT